MYALQGPGDVPFQNVNRSQAWIERMPSIVKGFGSRMRPSPAPTQGVTAFIDAHSGQYGVESSCRELLIAPSKYEAKAERWAAVDCRREPAAAWSFASCSRAEVSRGSVKFP